MPDKLGFLGPNGSYSEEAALAVCRRYFAGDRLLQPFASVEEVVEGVAGSIIREGVVPLENSLEGGVGATLHMLALLEGVYICRELVFPIEHCLLAARGVSMQDLSAVYSHPQALAQCRGFLRRHLPRAIMCPAASTAAAAALAAAEPAAAAIASRRAAMLFNLDLVRENIQDNRDNTTRFVVLARHDHPPTGDDKTSLVVSNLKPDAPGGLYHLLGFFACRQINLTRIESRPARRTLGEYIFFIDCVGHRTDPALRSLSKELQRSGVAVKILGSYPRAQGCAAPG